MTQEEARERIEREFATAMQAHQTGNDGMARVCARRAAGIAITCWLKRHSRNPWVVDAMGQLRKLQNDATMPSDVREAAQRLTTRITGQFTSPVSTDPIEDSKIIVSHLLPKNNPGSP